MWLQKFFSIRLKFIREKLTIIIKIFGIKIKVSFPIDFDIKIDNHITYTQNVSLVTNLIYTLKLAEDNEIFCLKNDIVCFIFNKNVLKWGADNFKEFVYNSFFALQKNPLEFRVLDENTLIYKEHAKRSMNNEFLWKYKLYSIDTVLHKFLSFDDNNNYWIHDKVFTDNKQYCKELSFIQNESKRKFIKGKTFSKYIMDLPYEEKKKETIRLVQFLLDNFTVEDNKLDSVLIDCHVNNIIVDDNGDFHYIDIDVKSEQPLNKESVINYLFKNTSYKQLQEEVLKHFGIRKLYDVAYFPDASLETSTLVEQIRDKYFIIPRK